MDRLQRRSSGNHLDLAAIEPLLTTRWLGKADGWDNELCDSIDSTNARASQLSNSGAPAGLIVLARHQTAGRGRQGRTWVSPADAGIYMSCLLRPTGNKADLPLHTIACGVACVQAIWEVTGLSIGLKWVNDLVAGRKKVGGILAELSGGPNAGPGEKELSLILGIGINLHLDQAILPDDLKGKVDSLENLSGQDINPNLLVAALVNHLEATVDLLDRQGSLAILNSWRQHSVTLGHQIHATCGDWQIDGEAIDIDDSGGLIIETADRGRITLSAGTITIRRSDGTYS